MALHLNLYHEIQKQELQRQRDPLKLGLYGILGLVAILLVYYFYRVEQGTRLANQAKQLQAQWQMTEPKAKEAELLEAQLMINLKTKDDLVHAIENRFYWAPLMERIQRMVPANVQITSFRGSMEPGTGKGLLAVSGIAAGDEPRRVAEDFRTNFAGKCLQGYKEVDSGFVSLGESDATVMLNGKALNTALFVLQFHFTVVDTGSSTTPAPRSQKGAR